MSSYAIIPEAFALAATGHREGENVFNATLTADGRHVCASNAITEFPLLFDGVTVTIVELELADFPPPAAPYVGARPAK
jgi:hypothetical protein